MVIQNKLIGSLEIKSCSKFSSQDESNEVANTGLMLNIYHCPYACGDMVEIFQIGYYVYICT